MPYFRPKSSFMFYMVILGFHFKSSWVYLFFGTFDGHLVSVNSYVNWCNHDIRNYSKITVLWWKEPLATTVGTNFPTHKQTVEREGDCCSTRSVLGTTQVILSLTGKFRSSHIHEPANDFYKTPTPQPTIDDGNPLATRHSSVGFVPIIDYEISLVYVWNKTHWPRLFKWNRWLKHVEPPSQYGHPHCSWSNSP